MDLGSNDTDNDFTNDDYNDKDFVPNDEHESMDSINMEFVPNLQQTEQQSQQQPAPEMFADLTNYLENSRAQLSPGAETRRMRLSLIGPNLGTQILSRDENHRMHVSPVASDFGELRDEHPSDYEFPLDRALRLQREEDTRLAGRLTSPPDEVRRRPRTKVSKAKGSVSNQARTSETSTVDSLLNDLRRKQLDLLNEQINVQKVLCQNALIAQDEAQERVLLIKAQTACAELELVRKQREVNQME